MSLDLKKTAAMKVVSEVGSYGKDGKKKGNNGQNDFGWKFNEAEVEIADKNEIEWVHFSVSRKI